MNESKAARYQRYRRRAETAGVVSGAAMLALVALTPLSRWLATGAEGFGSGLPDPAGGAIALVVFIILVVVAWELAAMPAMLYLGLRVDRRFANPSIAVEDVLAAQAHAALVALPAALIAGGLLRFSAWIGGDWWWALAGALLGAALVAALHGAPVLLARLADVRPLARTDLSARLNVLAARAQVPVTSVQEMLVDEGERATALVTGAGRSRRIFLASPLVRDWSDDEIAVVVAHELGHHAHRDLWRTLALDASILAVSLFVADRALGWMAPDLGFVGPRDLAALPLITLVAGFVWLLMTPLRHAHSRFVERRADEFALALTDGADAFASAVRRLGARHLSEDRPSFVTRWLFHRHPTPEQRLALAAAHRPVRRAD